MKTTLEKGQGDVPPSLYLYQENELLSHITHVQTKQSLEEKKANQFSSIQNRVQKKTDPLIIVLSCRVA